MKKTVNEDVILHMVEKWWCLCYSIVENLKLVRLFDDGFFQEMAELMRCFKERRKEHRA